MALSEIYDRPTSAKTDAYGYSWQSLGTYPEQRIEFEVTMPATGALLTGFAAADASYTDPVTGGTVITSGIFIKHGDTWVIPVRDGLVGDSVLATARHENIRVQLDSGAVPVAGGKAYIIPASGEVTHVSTSNELIGRFNTATTEASSAIPYAPTGKTWGKIEFDGTLI